MSRTFYLIGPALLLSLAAPLAVFAALTTFLAFTTLFIRVAIVYFELTIALVHSWVFAEKIAKPVPGIKANPPSPTSSLHRHTRKRRQSPSDYISSKDVLSSHRPPTKSESFASLVGSGGLNRDFEGVGGWRDANGQDDAVWAGLNSRLELPAAVSDQTRNHKRSHSFQSQRHSVTPEAFRMSPVASRNRTPPAADANENSEGYFYMRRTGKVVPMSPEEASAKLRMDERRASLGSGSSSSSGPTLKLSTTY